MDLNELIATQKKALDWWYEGFGTGDIEFAYKGFEDDCTWSGVGADLRRTVYHGKENIVRYQSTWVHTVWDGKMTYFPQNALCDGNVLLADWTDEAVNRETGEKYTNMSAFVFEFDGKPLVQRARCWFDLSPLRGKAQETFETVDLATGG